jgi:hypothetical protein
MTWKKLPRGAEICYFFSLLCISEVFTMDFSPESSTFDGLSTVTAQHNNALPGSHSIDTLTARFATAQLSYPVKNRA